MFKSLKKNYLLLISIFLILYFFFNFLSGQRGFFSYLEKKQILNNLEINGRDIESVLLLLEGDIDLNKISKLTDQMDLPGGRQLKKAQQKQSL